MAVICFISYEIHPTTWGGCGVLLRHAAELLLDRGHTVIFLLDLSAEHFRQFDRRDRPQLPNADRCRAYRVDDLCVDLPCPREHVGNTYQYNSLRLAQAYQRLAARERIDYAEFFDYCGPGYYTMARRLYGEDAGGAVLGIRIHTTVEMMDVRGATRCVDRERYGLYALERASLRLAEAVLVPSRMFYEHSCKQHYGLADERVVVSEPPKTVFPRVRRRPDAQGPFRVLSIGRMYHLKGVDQLVHAGVLLLRRRPELNVTFEFVGYDGNESPFGSSYTEYLRTLIPAALQPRFAFPGQLTHDQIAERLNDTLFAVFPNQIESFCYAVHETYDAGVPVVLNDLPAFRSFFEHERNSLIYDGSTEGLLAAMERLLDDGALRERLCHPYDVATNPLGTFYDSPQPRSPLLGSTGAPSGAEMATVIVLGSADQSACDRTQRALAVQTDRHFRRINLVPTTPDGEETFWWLGRSWHARSAEGNAIPATDLITSDALAILDAGDEPHPTWMALARGALRHRANMGFAGTWWSVEDRTEALTLDIAPELYPFERGTALTRTLIRTQPGQLLIDLLDPNLGRLGEVGCLFKATAHWGPGVLYPEPLIRLAGPAFEAVDEHSLQYLLGRYGQSFAERLSVLCGILQNERRRLDPQQPGGGGMPPLVPVETKLRLADELGGRDLLRMGFRKLARRIIRLGRR